jgi:hypothetical protein
MVASFEGNKAETHTMLPTIGAFMAAHRLAEVTIVASTTRPAPSDTRRARQPRNGARRCRHPRASRAGPARRPHHPWPRRGDQIPPRLVRPLVPRQQRRPLVAAMDHQRRAARGTPTPATPRPVGLETLVPLRDLQVFVDQATKELPAGDPCFLDVDHAGAGFWCVLLERSVRAVIVVMPGVLGEH